MDKDQSRNTAPINEVADKTDVTEQDEKHEAHPLPPIEERIRHWYYWRNGGLLCSGAGVIMLIAGYFSGSARAIQIAGFLILAGAVIFTVGVIGSWITHE